MVPLVQNVGLYKNVYDQYSKGCEHLNIDLFVVDETTHSFNSYVTYFPKLNCYYCLILLTMYLCREYNLLWSIIEIKLKASVLPTIYNIYYLFMRLIVIYFLRIMKIDCHILIRLKCKILIIFLNWVELFLYTVSYICDFYIQYKW